MVHDDGALLVVDLCVDASVTDQVDDPLLTLVLRQTKTLGKVPKKNNVSKKAHFREVFFRMRVLDIYSLMDLAV